MKDSQVQTQQAQVQKDKLRALEAAIDVPLLKHCHCVALTGSACIIKLHVLCLGANCRPWLESEFKCLPK